MRVRFWGTRGSVPSPGPATVRYGGNTSCVEIRTDTDQLLIIDCGTGLRSLGQQLLNDRRGMRGSIFISHTHWDHIHGLPFFAPLFVEGSHWDIYGPRGLLQSLDRVLAGQMEYQYFPVGLDEAQATVNFHDLVEGSLEIADVRVRTHYLNHPALTLGYRVEADDAVVVYASDHEQHPPTHTAHTEFLRGADLLIHDSQYEEANYAAKVGWGHSTMEYVVDTALEAGVGRLALYHHDPNRHDDAVDDLLARARQRAGEGLDVVAATEGMTIEVLGRGVAARAASESKATYAPAFEAFPRRIHIAVDDARVAAVVRSAADAEGLEVTDERDDAVVVESDWFSWPCSVAYVRTKLRAAVLRRAVFWEAAPLPLDEDARIASLVRLAILDTAPEDRFDALANAARLATNTPIALVTLIDGERQWFKAHLGFDSEESHRDESFCAHAILGDTVMQVTDALEDLRFADNPAVTGPSRVRFYAGAPLTLGDGQCVGTLCVADNRPRVLNDKQIDELRRLAALVVVELEKSA